MTHAVGSPCCFHDAPAADVPTQSFLQAQAPGDDLLLERSAFSAPGMRFAAGPPAEALQRSGNSAPALQVGVFGSFTLNFFHVNHEAWVFCGQRGSHDQWRRHDPEPCRRCWQTVVTSALAVVVKSGLCLMYNARTTPWSPACASAETRRAVGKRRRRGAAERRSRHAGLDPGSAGVRCSCALAATRTPSNFTIYALCCCCPI